MTTSTPLVQPDRYEKMGAKHFVGIDRSYTFPNMFGIPGQWMEFGAHFGKVPNQIGRRAYGVSHNMRPDGIDYMTGVEVSSFDGAPANFTKITTEPQTYAVFKHAAHVSALPATHQAIWSQWMPQSGKQPTHTPVFEVYLEDFNPLMGTGGIEIWVPVKE
jgi:AraC family transcriptional regulator